MNKICIHNPPKIFCQIIHPVSVNLMMLCGEIADCYVQVWTSEIMCKSFSKEYFRIVFCTQGMIAGHAYYFLEDVYPRMTGRRPLRTPSFIKALFADDPVVVAQPAHIRFAAPPADEIHQD